ncbi:MAG: segregation/condensation protein A [Labilithrix sp.]|nr:segregation/condensation protein A [Labilithrix sp.]
MVSEVELNEAPPAGGYSVTLPTFEGPLDLLLHLCQKHELDILDIPIAFVTEKYLEYLSVLQLLNLDIASEYLVMAATLAHIKSKMLLPAPPPGQEDEIAAEEQDPREALIRRLLEYQKYKQAGAELAARGVAGRDVFLRGMPIEEAVHTGLPPLAQVPLFSLVEAFQSVLAKSNVKLSHDIVHERVTLADRINELVDILRARRRVTFEELFADLETRFDLVITFLALLEMTRLRMTRLFQADFDSHIYIEFTAQVTADAEDGGAAAPDGGATLDAGAEVETLDANGHAPAVDAKSDASSDDALGDGEETDSLHARVDDDTSDGQETDSLHARGDDDTSDVPGDDDTSDGQGTDSLHARGDDDDTSDGQGTDTLHARGDDGTSDVVRSDGQEGDTLHARGDDDTSDVPGDDDTSDVEETDTLHARGDDGTSDVPGDVAGPAPRHAHAEEDAGGVSEDAEDENT